MGRRLTESYDEKRASNVVFFSPPRRDLGNLDITAYIKCLIDIAAKIVIKIYNGLVLLTAFEFSNILLVYFCGSKYTRCEAWRANNDVRRAASDC